VCKCFEDEPMHEVMIFEPNDGMIDNDNRSQFTRIYHFKNEFICFQCIEETRLVRTGPNVIWDGRTVVFTSWVDEK